MLPDVNWSVVLWGLWFAVRILPLGTLKGPWGAPASGGPGGHGARRTPVGDSQF